VAAGQIDERLEATWQRLLEVRDEVYRELEQARQSGVVGKPLESRVEIKASGEQYDLLRNYLDQLPALLIVSQVSLEESKDGAALQVNVTPPVGGKCERCWLVLETVGEDEEYPGLCARCSAVVAEVGADQVSAE
jgi:isoleucyl-tRNA synthetase